MSVRLACWAAHSYSIKNSKIFLPRKRKEFFPQRPGIHDNTFTLVLVSIPAMGLGRGLGKVAVSAILGYGIHKHIRGF